jgi:hypothetical protein
MANQFLLTYSVLDNKYSNGKVFSAGGLEDADSTPTPANVGTIDDRAGTGVPLAATDPDPRMFSFAYKSGAWMLGQCFALAAASLKEFCFAKLHDGI